MKKGFILIAALLMLFSIELVGQIPLVYDFEFDIISNYPGQLTVEWNTVGNQGDWQSMFPPIDFSGTSTIAHQHLGRIYQVRVTAINAIMVNYNEIRAVYQGNNYFLIDLRIPLQEPEPDPK